MYSGGIQHALGGISRRSRHSNTRAAFFRSAARREYHSAAFASSTPPSKKTTSERPHAPNARTKSPTRMNSSWNWPPPTQSSSGEYSRRMHAMPSTMSVEEPESAAIERSGTVCSEGGSLPSM